MKLVTWNVNSLKVRMPRMLEFLERHAPDVVCLQETKSEPGAFPVLELEAAGYSAIHHSSGRWAAGPAWRCWRGAAWRSRRPATG